MRTDKEYLADWNKLHCSLVADGRLDRNECMADYCEKLLDAAKQQYYSGEPLMSDRYFDKLEGYLRCLRPSSRLLVKVGGVK